MTYISGQVRLWSLDKHSEVNRQAGHCIMEIKEAQNVTSQSMWHHKEIPLLILVLCVALGQLSWNMKYLTCK